MSLNLQTKLLLALSGLTILVLVLVLYAVNSVATSSITQEVVADFEQTQGFFQRTQNLRYDRLVESAFLIQENSTFKATLDLDDPSSMQFGVEQQFAPIVKADLFVVTNKAGKVLAWLGRSGQTGTDLSDQPTINNALQGIEPPLENTWPDLWAVNGMLYQVVSVPVFTQNEMIGTITLGSQFTSIEATNLMQNTPLEVTFILDGEPFTTSASRLDTAAIKNIVNSKRSFIDSLLANNLSSKPFREIYNDEEYFSFISPLGTGEDAFYIASVPVSVELQILDKIQANIYVIAIVAIIITIPIAVYFGRIISKPVKSLSNAMAKVRQGDLNVSVEKQTDDEIGNLAQAFNEMIIGLRERFTLQKYVGGHTLEMLKEHSQGEVMLGGSRKEMAILFTDIRNSTELIQSASPEKFIIELNKTLTNQAEYVSYYNGSIDKFIGDSMVALFTGDDSLYRAVKCSISIQKEFEMEHSQNPYFDGLGIGVNFGSMVMGNMGANKRMDYTVIGSEVNLCARLCSAARKGEILLPRTIAERFLTNTRTKFEPINQRNLKGFSEEFEIVKISYE